MKLQKSGEGGVSQGNSVHVVTVGSEDPVEVDQKRRRANISFSNGPKDVLMFLVDPSAKGSKNVLVADSGFQARQAQ